MKSVIIALALVAIAAPASAAEYGVKAQRAAVECTAKDIGAAFRGDFSNWVLPAWVPGKHLRAGVISKCAGAGR